MADLKHIFAALVPENIKNIPLVDTAMQIFMANLEENSSLSWSIKNIYDTAISEADSVIRQKSKTALRKGLVDTYLATMHETIVLAQNNVPLKDKLVLRGLDANATLSNDAEKFLGIEHNITNKQFKQTVGTTASINYAHEIAKALESNLDGDLPTVIETKPFHLTVEGPLTGEIYSSIVKTLAHPVGFTFDYQQVIKASLVDLFGLNKIYTVKDIEIRGSDGTIDVFTNGTVEDVWTIFQNRNNYTTNKLFTRAEFDILITVWENKTVKDIVDPLGLQESGVMFTDGTYLVRTTDTVIQFVNYNDWRLDNPNFLLKDFSTTTFSHYSVYTDYSFVLEPGYGDDVTSIIDFVITYLDDATGNPALIGTPEQLTYLDHNNVAQPIDTTDHHIMTSTNFVVDDFFGFSTSNGGNYLVSTDVGSSNYLTTSDANGGFYLVFVP